MVYDDESEYPPDVISCYFYELEKDGDDFKIKCVWCVNVANWIAEKNGLLNWHYYRIVRETEKAVLIEGKNYEGKDKWMGKSQVEYGDRIVEGGDYFRAHRSLIQEEEGKKGRNVIS